MDDNNSFVFPIIRKAERGRETVNLDNAIDAWGTGDSATVRRDFQSMAERGDVIAQTVLGIVHRLGLGGARNYKEAFKWFWLAANQGNPTAQNNLGVMYIDGEGARPDKTNSVKWFRLSAEQGNATAQLNLGAMYAHGSGVPQDNVTAHMWCSMSAANGCDEAKSYRDHLVEKMTLNEVSEAQQRFHENVAFNSQQNC